MKLIYSNCLLQSIYMYVVFHTNSRIGVDLNSPSGLPSFYCDIKHYNLIFRYRFRRKLRRHSNKGWFLFYGYNDVELIK